MFLGLVKAKGELDDDLWTSPNKKSIVHTFLGECTVCTIAMVPNQECLGLSSRQIFSVV